MHCLLDSVTPPGLASLQKWWHFTEEWMDRKDNQGIFHNGFWRKPKPVHSCPIYKWTTRTNQHHPTDLNRVTATQSEDLGQQGRALKQIIKCRDFCSCAVLSAHVLAVFVWAPCRGAPLLPETLTLSWTFPFWMALPWSCCFQGVSDGSLISNSKTPPSPGAAAASSANRATCKGQGLQHSWGWQDQLCAHHITPPDQRDKDRVAKARWEGSPPPLSCFLAAPQDLFRVSSSHCVILAVTSPVKPLHIPTAFLAQSHTLGSHSIHFSSSFLCPFTSQAAGVFFKAYILEIATVSNY